MSQLLVRVPRRSLLSQESIDLDEVVFEWTFISDNDIHWPVGKEVTGIGSIDSLSSIVLMPQVDQLIVFISTLDVRLIPMKIPLVSDEKIQLIMPGLLEDRLIGDINQLSFKILNPLEGDPALDRTVAVIDKNWLNWISSKVRQLNLRRIRLLPDCYLLSPVTSDQPLDGWIAQAPPNIAYEVIADQVIWTVRLGEQVGASWIDQINEVSQINHLNIHDQILGLLPSQLTGKSIAPFDWSSDWALHSLRELASLPDDEGVNLLLDAYPAANPKQSSAFIKDTVLKFFGECFTQWSWGSNKFLLIFAPLSFIVGYLFYGAVIFLINFGYNYQMNSLANEYIKESSLTSIQSNVWDFQQISNINHFLGQHHEQKRRIGELNQADFLLMSADLKRLIKIYGDGGIKRIHYKGSSIEFELRADFLNSRKITSEKVVSDAAALEMLVISLGRNRFQLLPYAGLGHGL